MNLEQFALSAFRLASELGYTSNNAVSFKVMGITSAQLPVSRTCVVSATAPPLYEGSVVRIWIDTGLSVYKSTNYRSPDNPSWAVVFSYESVFLETSVTGESTEALSTNGGQMEGPLLLSDATPTAPNEAVSLSYLEGVTTMILSSVHIEHPVQDLVALRAFDVTTIPDGQVIFMEATRKLYAYDVQAVGTDDGTYIVTPNSGVGRWIATVPNVLDGGMFD